MDTENKLPDDIEFLKTVFEGEDNCITGFGHSMCRKTN